MARACGRVITVRMRARGEARGVRGSERERGGVSDFFSRTSGSSKRNTFVSLRTSQMTSNKPSKITQELALQIVRSVYFATDGQPMRWRMLSGIRGATAEAVIYAVQQGWLKLEGNHSVCLTEEGRRLIAKKAN
jgi:hypothetical protein